MIEAKCPECKEYHEYAYLPSPNLLGYEDGCPLVYCAACTFPVAQVKRKHPGTGAKHQRQGTGKNSLVYNS